MAFNATPFAMAWLGKQAVLNDSFAHKPTPFSHTHTHPHTHSHRERFALPLIDTFQMFALVMHNLFEKITAQVSKRLSVGLSAGLSHTDSH